MKKPPDNYFALLVLLVSITLWFNQEIFRKVETLNNFMLRTNSITAGFSFVRSTIARFVNHSVTIGGTQSTTDERGDTTESNPATFPFQQWKQSFFQKIASIKTQTPRMRLATSITHTLFSSCKYLDRIKHTLCIPFSVTNGFSKVARPQQNHNKIVIQQASEENLEEILALVLKQWPQVRGIKEYFIECLKRQKTLIALENDVIIGSVSIADRIINLESVPLRSAGIFTLITDPSARGKGVGTKLMNRAKEVMFEDDVDISFLETSINSYYENFDWVTMEHPDLNFEINITEADAQSTHTGNFRGYQESDIEQIATVYNKCSKNRTLAPKRDKDYWIRYCNQFQIGNSLFFVLENEGEIQGFAHLIIDPSQATIKIMNLGYSSIVTKNIILYKILEYAKSRKIKAVKGSFVLENDFIKDIKGLKCSISFSPDTMLMLQMFEPARFFTKISPLIETRLRNAGLGSWSGTICISTESTHVYILIDRGRVRIEKSDNIVNADINLDIRQSDLLKIVFGHKTVGELNDVPSAIEHLSLLGVLFPSMDIFYRIHPLAGE
ncbi:MAG: GNAT family N-acetyltransferase [Deltaproteobacteria bacterium]|nr:GNAT family N-acetyltransferase [Deltaproteobacteria bacterium]